jgi:ribosomal protein S18 acetylase RimI-like enzyme
MVEPKHEIVDVTDVNVEQYDLLCLKSKPKEEGYRNKLAWFKEYYRKGLRVKLLRVYEGRRGFTSRGFIEYVPGEYTWRGIDAKGWMVIHCIWVVGRNKGYGFGSQLLEACFKDAKGMNGVAVVTSQKNWLPGKRIFTSHGFEKVDEIENCELYAKKFKKNGAMPRFNVLSQERLKSYRKGLIIFESPQCPYSNNGAKALKEMASKVRIPLRVEHISSHMDAQKNGLHPYGTFCVVLNGKVVSYYPGDVKEVKKHLTR